MIKNSNAQPQLVLDSSPDRNQREVIQHRSGPCLVLAGAGAGKTFSIIGRVFQLISAGVDPSKILLITFSRKATQELKQRYDAGRMKSGVIITNYHSLGFRFLSKYHSNVGLRNDHQSRFSLVENEELLNIYYSTRQITDKAERSEISYLYRIIDMAENYDIIIRNDELSSLYSDFSEFVQKEFPKLSGIAIQKTWRLGEEISELKERFNVVTFNDLISLPNVILANSPSIREENARQYEYIIVDEFQDTNVAQFNMLRYLTNLGKNPNIMVVGDDDQSIYEWRGAAPSNIRKFHEEYGSRIIKLELNYRSEKRIVECSSRLISNNQSRMPKNPIPIKNIDDKNQVKIDVFESERSMIANLGDEIEALINGGCELNKIAILIRNRFMVLKCEAELIRRNIPVTVVGAKSFFEYKEIKFCLSALRLFFNKRDIQAFLNLKDLIPGLGDKKIRQIISELDSDLAISIEEAAKKLFENQRFYAGLKNIFELINNFPQYFGQMTNYMMEDDFFALRKHFSDKGEDAESINNRSLRLRIFQEFFKNILAEVLTESDDEASKWNSIIEIITAGEVDRKNDNTVVISTIHQSKGLEFDYVFIPYFTEGLMPADVRKEEADNIFFVKRHYEEERRIAYVAITRARKKLCLLHANSYMMYGKYCHSGISSYVKEFQEILHNEEISYHQE